MKLNYKTFLVFAIAICSISLATAGSFKIQFPSGTDIFTVDTSGNANATGWIAENGVKLEDTYCKLTGCTMTGNLDLTGYNVTADYYYGSGAFLSDVNVTLTHGAITIDGANITTGTIDIARLPDLANSTTLDWGNITGRPNLLSSINGITNDTGNIDLVAGSGITIETVNGNYLEINATVTMDYTNVALTNITNTFAEDQLFSKNVNVTGDVNVEGKIQKNSTSSSIDIEDDGDIVLVLT